MVQREENVLAQEAVLDALLRSEEQGNPWRWGSESQLGAVGGWKCRLLAVVVKGDDNQLSFFPTSVLQP